jgi:hypothetical protein
MKLRFWLPILLCLSACLSERQAQLTEIEAYVGTGGGLRGFELGTPKERLRTAERAKLVFDDSLGLAFQILREDSTRLEIEYFTPNDSLIASVVNVYLTDEKKANRLYRLLADHYNDRYGKHPSGSFGHYIWERKGQFLHLRLLPDRQTLTLNLTLSHD